MGTQQPDFTHFYQRSRDSCLRAVLASAGDQDTAQDLVDEAFAFRGQPNPACVTPRTHLSQQQLHRIFTAQLPRGATTGDAFSINPSAIPSGLGVQISRTKPSAAPKDIIQVGVVQASQQCTGIS